MERGFGSRWLMSAKSWGENIGRYIGILMCSSIGWAAARWRRRAREIREELRRQEALMLKKCCAGEGALP